MRTDERQRWLDTLASMLRCVDNDMPACIKAHYVVNVMLPRLYLQVGIEAMSAEFARQQAKSLSLLTGTCLHCHKKPSVIDDDICPACLAEFDQFAAEIDSNPYKGDVP